MKILYNKKEFIPKDLVITKNLGIGSESIYFKLSKTKAIKIFMNNDITELPSKKAAQLSLKNQSFLHNLQLAPKPLSNIIKFTIINHTQLQEHLQSLQSKYEHLELELMDFIKLSKTMYGYITQAAIPINSLSKFKNLFPKLKIKLHSLNINYPDLNISNIATINNKPIIIDTGNISFPNNQK